MFTLKAKKEEGIVLANSLLVIIPLSENQDQKTIPHFLTHFFKSKIHHTTTQMCREVWEHGIWPFQPVVLHCPL